MASRKHTADAGQNDLFNEGGPVVLPTRLTVDGKVLGSLVRQLIDDEFPVLLLRDGGGIHA